MKSMASRLLLLLAGAIVLIFLAVLTASHPLDCSQPDVWPPRLTTGRSSLSAAAPTPAPPQNQIFVRVESDRPDIEVGWASN